MSTTPLNKNKKRGRGRPKSEDRLIIDSERAQFKLKNRIISVSPEALEVIYELMMDKSAPGQTRSSNAKVILEMAAELHQQLIESEAAEVEESQEEIQEEVVEEAPKFTVITAEFKG